MFVDDSGADGGARVAHLLARCKVESVSFTVH